MASKIQWTEETWNPIRARDKETGKVGWVCVHVSPGCINCYAETQNVSGFRGGTGRAYLAPALRKVDAFLDEKTLAKPLHWKAPRLIFPCSMTDIFGEWVTDEWLDKMFAVMALTPQHTYQVLTKRPERMRKYLSGEPGLPKKWHVDYNAGILARRPVDALLARNEPWPLPNVWLGVSAEDQPRWDERVHLLQATPAAKRWVSYEPALGPIKTGAWADEGIFIDNLRGEDGVDPPIPRIDWIVVGGESGRKARPFDVSWARSVIAQCREAQVTCFIKQLGSRPFEHFRDSTEWPVDMRWAGDELLVPALADIDREPDWWSPVLKHPKGGNWDEWADDLKVREMPE